MKITPTWTADFETNLSTIILGTYENAVQNLHWDRLMTVKQSMAGRELIMWLLETAKLYDRGNGGNTRIDELAGTYFEIINRDIGAGLTLTRNEIEDNQLNRPSLPQGMSPLDLAGQWARSMGALSAYHPQNLLYQLIAAGESAKGYDGVSFFNTAHPVNGVDATHGTFANVFTGAAYDLIADVGQANYGKAAQALNDALAQIAALKLPNGMPRRLRPKTLLVPPAKRLVAQQLTAASTINATDNMSRQLGLEPVVADELVAAPDDWYIGCEVIGDNTVGPFIFQDRRPFELTSFSPLDQVQLNAKKEFLWDYDGRNASSYGHPYLFFKFKKA